MNLRLAIGILWPAFLVAAMATGLTFAIIDPTDIAFFGKHVALTRETMYSLGFLAFWFFCALSGLLTLYLASSKRPRESDLADDD